MRMPKLPQTRQRDHSLGSLPNIELVGWHDINSHVDGFEPICMTSKQIRLGFLWPKPPVNRELPDRRKYKMHKSCAGGLRFR